jgi:hypothetical protein
LTGYSRPLIGGQRGALVRLANRDRGSQDWRQKDADTQ